MLKTLSRKPPFSQKYVPFIFILIFIEMGCASAPRSRFADVYLTNKARYQLLPPEYIEKPVDGPEQIEGSYGGGDFVMNAWVKADASGIEMNLFNSFGVDMGSLVYRDGAISFSSTVFPPNLKPEYIAADFQLCFYDADALAAALKKIGLGFKVDGGRRTVLDGRKPIIEIIKTSESVRYDNLLRSYSYTLYGDF